jgi:hypothetical protein
VSACPNCGGTILGDGYRVVRHCENADQQKVWEAEPDAKVVLCEGEDK